MELSLCLIPFGVKKKLTAKKNYWDLLVPQLLLQSGGSSQSDVTELTANRCTGLSETLCESLSFSFSSLFHLNLLKSSSLHFSWTWIGTWTPAGVGEAVMGCGSAGDRPVLC